MKKMTCDPGVCDYCQYLEDGDFLCEKYMEIVVEDWEPTRYFQMCMKKSHSGGAVCARIKSAKF